MADPVRHRVLVTGGSGFIGVNLIAELSRIGATSVNFDIAPPLDEGQQPTWVEGDILDRNALGAVVADLDPTHVVHLAARVDVRGKDSEDYRVNTEGTKNLLDAVGSTPSLRRVIVASTQFVVAPGVALADITATSPHTAYGESKAVCESITRASRLPWIIVRPTTVWGPYDLEYRRQFYKTMERGLYRHPRGEPCFRSFGFVGNVVDQVVRLMTVPDSACERTFYLGDPILNLFEFADAFSQKISGRSVRQAPRGLLRVMGTVGDLLRLLKLPAPITTQRYRSMTEDYFVPLEPTFELLGLPPLDLLEGVDRTVEWLRAEGVLASSPQAARI